MKDNTLDLNKIVKQIPDRRRDQGKRYKAEVIVWILVLGKLLGKKNLVEIYELFKYNKELRKYVSKFSNQKLVAIPHPTTITRALEKLGLTNLVKQLNLSQVEQKPKTSEMCVAGDGKVIRGIHDGSKRQILSFVDQDLFPLGQVEISEKENEITALVNLLEENNLVLPEGSLLTLDAIHTQVSTIKQLQKKKLNYLLKVKGNQKELKNQLNYIFHQGELDKSNPLKINTYKKSENDHDRETTWETTSSTDFCSKDLPKGFESVKTIGFIETSTKRPIYKKYSGEKYYKFSKHRTYFITSVTKTSKELFNISRNHWRVEKLHWLKDTIYLEDQQTIKSKPAYFLTFLKSLSIYLVQKLSNKVSHTMRRLSLDSQFLEQSLKQLGIL